MKQSTKLAFWVDEAIGSLGYLKPTSATKLCAFMSKNLAQHPKQLSVQYRKAGTQLTADEKKELGIRSNAAMSKEALSDLSEKGRTSPLSAHEQTMLRALLACGRAQSIDSERAVGVARWEVLGAFPDQCSGCKRLDGKIISDDDADPVGPADCFREACAIGYAPVIENLMVPDDGLSRPSRRSSVTKPWWKFW